jgi:hypothetical protein
MKEKLKKQKEAIEMAYSPPARLSISSDEHPGLKDCDVGERYVMDGVHVTLKSLREREKGGMEGEFEVTKVDKESEEKAEKKKEKDE